MFSLGVHGGLPRFLGAMHPKQEVCRETVTMVQTYRGDSRGLNCARASIEETGRIRHYSMR